MTVGKDGVVDDTCTVDSDEGKNSGLFGAFVAKLWPVQNLKRKNHDRGHRSG